jgi:hypothetical protein
MLTGYLNSWSGFVSCVSVDVDGSARANNGISRRNGPTLSTELSVHRWRKSLQHEPVHGHARTAREIKLFEVSVRHGDEYEDDSHG